MISSQRGGRPPAAITIGAPSDEVWPWLVQMGYGRGGWYSYDWLERRVGAGDFAEGGSAMRVIPELQPLATGDTVALSPAGGLIVARSSTRPERLSCATG